MAKLVVGSSKRIIHLSNHFTTWFSRSFKPRFIHSVPILFVGSMVCVSTLFLYTNNTIVLIAFAKQSKNSILVKFSLVKQPK